MWLICNRDATEMFRSNLATGTELSLLTRVGGRVGGWVVGKLESNAKLNSKLSLKLKLKLELSLAKLIKI